MTSLGFKVVLMYIVRSYRMNLRENEVDFVQPLKHSIRFHICKVCRFSEVRTIL